MAARKRAEEAADLDAQRLRFRRRLCAAAIAWLLTGLTGWGGEPRAQAQDAAAPHSPRNAFHELQRRVQRIEGPRGTHFQVVPRAGEARPPAGEIDTREDAAQGEADARKHYTQIAAALQFPGGQPPESLDELLAFLGYSALRAEHLERAQPDVLMNPAQLARETGRAALSAGESAMRSGDLLAVRYFSPTTTDVSGKAQPVAYSWRKLVRLRPRLGSPAAARGVAAMHVLLSWFEADLERDPFSGRAVDVQVMLTPTAAAAIDWPWPACWLVFGAPREGSRLQASITASWDAADPRLANPNDRRYYVPVSCMHCHGGNTYGARLNVLDSDHWEDRVQGNDDFAAVGRSRWPAVFDGGPPSPSAAREQVFAVLRTLNAEIHDQNESADEFSLEAGKTPSPFHTRFVANWLRLHADSAAHRPPPERGIPGADGSAWEPDNQVDEALTRLLNQYCYRCHSSLSYHVFDKQAVSTNRDMMVLFLDEDGYDAMQMPQDRILNDEQRQALREALEKLESAP